MNERLDIGPVHPSVTKPTIWRSTVMTKEVHPSVLVANIGNAFLPGVQEAVEAAANVYARTGARCVVAVQPNLCVVSPFGLDSMRNFMVLRACAAGFDYILFLDNDVLLEDPETVVKLVARGHLYIIPWFDQSPIGRNEILGNPMYDADQGLMRMEWTVPYCSLINTAAFKLAGRRPFGEQPIYSKDEYDSLWFTQHGVEIWQDTNVKVKLLRPPGSLVNMVGNLRPLKPFEMP